MGLEQRGGLDSPDLQVNKAPSVAERLQLPRLTEKIGRTARKVFRVSLLGSTVAASGPIHTPHPAYGESLHQAIGHTQTVPARDLTIPETWEIPLPETVQEAEAEAEEPAVLDTTTSGFTEGQVLGGGTAVPTPQETAQQSSELFETTPQGRLQTEKFPEGEVGWKPRKESTAQTDEFFAQVGVTVKFKSNPQLRGGIGTYTLYPCEICTKTPERYGIFKGVVDPADPRLLIMEYNIFRPDYKLDPAWREQLSDMAAGSAANELSKIFYGKSSLDGLPQEQANYIGQLSYRLQYEIRPLELIAPTIS